MILSFQQIKQIIEKGVSPKLKTARDIYKELNLHVTGKGTVEALEKIDRYENLQQLRLREKLVKSNRSLFSFVARPTDKVFSAKGGEIAYNLSASEVKRLNAFTEDIADGLDIRSYIQKKVFNQYLVDPNGILFLEISKDGSRVEPVVYNSDQLLDYGNRGNNVEYIVFEHHKNKEDQNDKKEYYRVVDESGDFIYVKDGERIYLDEEKSLSLYFDFFPAFILGDRFNINEPVFDGLFSDVVEDAKDYLRDQSINLVHKMAHGYSKYWTYPEDCTQCSGSGEVQRLQSGNVEDNTAVYEQINCSSCGGSGQKARKDTSDILIVPIPQDGDPNIAPDVAGYISPDIEIWNKYDENLKSLKHSIFETTWGTAYETEKTNETATGRFLDVQPVQDRLSGISKHFASIESFLLRGLGTIYLGKKNYKPTVVYGDRYIMETPKQALESFVTVVSNDNIPYILKQSSYETLCEIQHQSNRMEFIKKTKLLKVDPFPYQSLSILKELGVPKEDLLKKIYYPSWVNSVTEEQLMFNTVEQLKESLNQFINAKTITNGTGNE